MRDDGQVDATARVVLILTGAGIKNPPPPLPAPTHLEGDEPAMRAQLKRAMESA